MPIAWLIGLILLKFKQQISFLVHTALSLSLALLVYLLWDSSAAEWMVLVALLLASAFAAWVHFIFDKRSEKLSSVLARVSLIRKSGRFLLPVLSVIAGVLLILDLNSKGLIYHVLPETLQNRIGQISLETSSAVGRLEMYRDALRISADYPFGIGGDGWRIVYPWYQKLPYYSNEIHNGYLEILLSIGWLGIIVFLTFFSILLFRLYRTGANAAFAALMMLLFHAVIDFDFSFGFYWFMIIWLFAAYVPFDLLPANHSVYARKTARPRGDGFRVKPLSLAAAAVTGIIVIAGFIFSLRFYIAEKHFLSIQDNIPIEQAVQIAESAQKKNPYHVDYGLQLLNMYAYQYTRSGEPGWEQKIDAKADELLRLEPHNARLHYAISLVYAQIAEWEKAFESIDQAIKYEKFNADYYRFSIEYKTRVGQVLLNTADRDWGNQLLLSSVQDYERYQEWSQAVSQVQVPDRRPNLALPRSVHLMSARAYLLLDKPTAAMDILARFRPSIEEGIVDKETGQVLVSSFDFESLEDMVLREYDKIVILTVKDEAQAQLPNSFVQFMTSQGSNIKELKYRGSYAAVFVNKMLIKEEVNNQGAIDFTQESSPELFEIFQRQPFHIHSSGKEYGNRSSIKLGDREYSLDQRGINLAVFDLEMNHLYSFTFDTHQSDIKIFRK
jgi:hypothetical protein